MPNPNGFQIVSAAPESELSEVEWRVVDEIAEIFDD